MTIASTLASMLEPFFGSALPIRLKAWDGSTAGSPGGIEVAITTPDALRRLVWRPGELGAAQAYVTGEITIDADLSEALDHLRQIGQSRNVRMRDAGSVLRAIPVLRRLGAFGRPPEPPSTQAKIIGRRHSQRRDSRAISHHYDLSNEFYELLLDETMSYSCGYWTSDAADYGIDDAQRDKADLVCQKLGLEPGMRLLDVGCGWGALSVHAAERYDVHVTAVTISRQQEQFIARRIAQCGVADKVDVRCADYRDAVPPAGSEFDAVASIEMGEHVGQRNYPAYVSVLRRSVKPGGHVLIQQMSRTGKPGGGPFIEAFIAPDMHMRPLGQTVALIEGGGLEVRNVHGLREHYVRTAQAWRQQFSAHRHEFEGLVGSQAACVWDLYLAGGMLAFRDGRMGVDQILARRPDPARHSSSSR